MKTIKLFIVAFALLTTSFSNSEAQLTDAERKYAANLLQETEDNLLKKIKGLSAEQLNFKSDTNSWSIAQVVEHLAISENNFNEFVQMALKEKADPQKRAEVKMADAAVVQMITDRSHKAKTSEKFEPTGKFGSFQGSVKEFKTKRDNNIRYIKSTSDDLRNHYNDFPFGKIDTYQTILFMAGHSKRHTDQIDEVLRHPDFPKD
jgi:uncharacterized damage-inducible protein DinB